MTKPSQQLTPIEELFQPKSKRAEIAARLLAGGSVKEIIKSLKLEGGVEVYATRRKLVEAGHLQAGAGGTRKSSAAAPAAPVVQFHPETRSFKIKALIDAGKSDEQIIAQGFTAQQIYSTRYQIKKKIEAGVPGKALVLHIPKAAKANGNGHAAPAALKPKRKGNGHDLAALTNALNGAAFSVPVVEAILHTPGGEAVRVFSSPDIFPLVYARAAKATGFIE